MTSDNKPEDKKPEDKAPELREVTLVVTARVPKELNDEEVLALFASSGFDSAKFYKETKADPADRKAGKDPKSGKKAGPTHDAYGNPYSKSGPRSNTHDAYGNAYNAASEGGGGSHGSDRGVDPSGRYDAYGNPY